MRKHEDIRRGAVSLVAAFCLAVMLLSFSLLAADAGAINAHVASRCSHGLRPRLATSPGASHVKRGRARRICAPVGNRAVRGPAPQLGGGYPNARIAEVGLSRLGQWGGECKEAVNVWVAIASGSTQHLGGDYLANYRYEGGREVSRDATVEGDIIQLNGPNGNYYYEGMHTAVIVSHASGSEGFEVVDSNSEWNRIVREHAWNPYATARRYGLSVHIWRMGSAGSPEASPPTSSPSGPIQGSSPVLQGGSGSVVQPAGPEGSSGGGSRSGEYHGPVFTVMNTSETPPDGVWFRNSPHEGDTSRITGLGVYMNERVELRCYAFGDAVGPYADRLWYYSVNVSRPTNAGQPNRGYLNAHFINDGKVANEVDGGVPAC
jgi:hypothetical protein